MGDLFISSEKDEYKRGGMLWEGRNKSRDSEILDWAVVLISLLNQNLYINCLLLDRQVTKLKWYSSLMTDQVKIVHISVTLRNHGN